MKYACVIACAIVPPSLAPAAPPLNTDAVPDADELAPFFEAAATRRVDVVGVGDSNQVFGGHGWDHGLILAYDARFNAYATSLLSMGENAGNGSAAGAGYRMASTRSQNTFDYAGAPPELEIHLANTSGFSPLDYAYIPAGETKTLNNHGMSMPGFGVIDTNAALTLTTIHGVFPGAGGGLFRPAMRRGSPPWSVLFDHPTSVASSGPAWGVQRVDSLIPAANRPHGLQFLLTRFGASVQGPFLGYYMRVIETETETGATFGTLRDDQGSDPKVMVRINTGLNDRNEDLDPIGIDAELDSPEAFEQHIRSIIDRVRAVWTANAWDPGELYFCITTSHPTGNEDPLFDDDEELLAYRERARAVALDYDRCVAVDLRLIASSDEMLALSWYNAPTDRAHLRINGYVSLAEREVAALQNGRSWFDVDEDRRVDAEDLYALESGAAIPSHAPADLSTLGLRRAVRFLELSRSQTGRD